MTVVTAAQTTETTAAAPAEQAKPADDVLEIVLEGMAEPVKVPVSKIPMDKLNPHLAKLRSEADRRMSEADRRSKELDAQAERYSTVEKLAAAVKADPEKLIQLARELGLDDDALYGLSEKQVANRIKAQLRDQEEAADPTKKTQREQQEELERLRTERETLQKEREQEFRSAMRMQSESFIVKALETGGWPKGSPLAMEAAREMVPILRAAIEACQKEDLSDFALTHDQLAKAAKQALRQRASLLYDEDEEIEYTPKQMERFAAYLAKKNGTAQAAAPRHPAEQGGGTKQGQQQKKNGVAKGTNSSDLLLKLLRT